MLIRSGESGHPCLVPDLSGKLSFCPLSMMLAVGFLYVAFIMLRNAPSIPIFLSVFIINGCCTLSNVFSASIWSCGFCLLYCLCGVLHLLIYRYCTVLVSLGWIPLIMVYDLFLHLLLDLIYQYFVEDYSTYVHQRYWHVVFYEQLYAKKV